MSEDTQGAGDVAQCVRLLLEKHTSHTGILVPGSNNSAILTQLSNDVPGRQRMMIQLSGPLSLA